MNGAIAIITLFHSSRIKEITLYGIFTGYKQEQYEFFDDKHKKSRFFSLWYNICFSYLQMECLIKKGLLCRDSF